MTNTLEPVGAAPAPKTSRAAFADLVNLMCATVAASSARVYRQTIMKWAEWCDGEGLDPCALRPADVLAFLRSENTTKATRARQLSAIRKLAQMRFVLSPGDDDGRRTHEALKVIRPPQCDAAAVSHERTRRALTPAEADRLLRVWDGTDPRALRNRALVAVLLLAGLRRSEAAALLWSDIDFENGVIGVRHGKGDKSREVPLAGDFALDALYCWHRAQPAGRRCLFCAVRKGGKIGSDKPISGTDVYRVWMETAARAAIDSSTPHDARRTLITEALATGTPIQTVQAVVGHARGETTLRYARAVDARRARKELRLRYG